MAGGMDLGSGGKGRQKPLDAAINLVPFIDLMAVTIVFLIWTAVWTQLGRLEVSQAGQSTEPSPPSQAVPPPVLLVTEKALTLSVNGVASAAMPLTRDAHGRLEVTALAKSLAEVKAAQPDQAAITIEPEDGVPYDDLVRVLDACLGGKFPAVSVQSPAS